jgi:hypothetical protein
MAYLEITGFKRSNSHTLAENKSPELKQVIKNNKTLNSKEK